MTSYRCQCPFFVILNSGGCFWQAGGISFLIVAVHMLFGQPINEQTTGSCGLVMEAFQQLAFIWDTWVGELLFFSRYYSSWPLGNEGSFIPNIPASKGWFPHSLRVGPASVLFTATIEIIVAPRIVAEKPGAIFDVKIRRPLKWQPEGS